MYGIVEGRNNWNLSSQNVPIDKTDIQGCLQINVAVLNAHILFYPLY